MKLDPSKIRSLARNPLRWGALDELRREEKVIFVGGDVPAREALEGVYESHALSPAELVCIRFGGIDGFHRGEEVARLLKKNLNVRLLGRIEWGAPGYIVERAYAAGIDILDIPLEVHDPVLAADRGVDRNARLQALEHALAVFPRWSVVSSLAVGEEPLCSTLSGIYRLLQHRIVPLPALSPRAAGYPVEEVESLYLALLERLRKRKVQLLPLFPLLELLSPVTDGKRLTLLNEFLSRVQCRGLLAASDLRRALRVREVEDSFSSAGL